MGVLASLGPQGVWAPRCPCGFAGYAPAPDPIAPGPADGASGRQDVSSLWGMAILEKGDRGGKSAAVSLDFAAWHDCGL